ncbi:MAG: Isoprenyl transferase [Gammaproteobacteria bacterium]|nr:MAG: Isoprenyl transferase [Gammaproteobacteria bacterium]
MSNRNITHLSIIMDGNGRWANHQSMPRAFGHRAGIKSINTIVKACVTRQINELTLFAFSSENWNRPEYEVKFLLTLFEESINKYIEELHHNNIKIRFIGDHSVFNYQLVNSINNAEELTRHNAGLKLNFAINYGGQWEIINAFNKFISSNPGSTKITIEDFEKNLSLNHSKPDLLIRTGGEQRLSNFMLWQHAYTELYFTKCLWPDFNEKELDLAIKYFQNRNRKYGTINSENKLKKDV